MIAPNDVSQFPSWITAGTIAIEQIDAPSPVTFKLTRLADGKSLDPVSVASPYSFPVEGQSNSNLMHELRWYLEDFQAEDIRRLQHIPALLLRMCRQQADEGQALRR